MQAISFSLKETKLAADHVHNNTQHHPDHEKNSKVVARQQSPKIPQNGHSTIRFPPGGFLISQEVACKKALHFTLSRATLISRGFSRLPQMRSLLAGSESLSPI